jgi:hypothetical protein
LYHIPDVLTELCCTNGRGQNAHFPNKAMTAGITNKPDSRTINIATASMGPRDLNDPYDANVSADIATIVVPADPAIEGPTFDIVVRIAAHLFSFSTSSSLYRETMNSA